MDSEFYHKDLFGEVIDLEISPEAELGVASAKASARRGEFNVFALTDAVAERKKKDAWVLYRKALNSGLVPEEVFYKVIWILKTLILAERSTTAAEAELNPFVYRKAKGFLKLWRPGEPEDLVEKLVIGYHDARRGLIEFETMLEKILLSL